VDAALPHPLQVLRAEVPYHLKSPFLSNLSQDRDGGCGAIFAAGVVVGNVITVVGVDAGVVGALESARHFSPTRFLFYCKI